MRYEVLGPLRLVDSGESAYITSRKHEVVLASLLSRAGRVVPADRLITELWGDRTPRQATIGLQVYISHVRKAIARPGRDDSPIITRLPGYLLDLGSDKVDYQEFLELLDFGRADARAGRHEDAVEWFEHALALWRGPVLGDLLPGRMLSGFVTWLDESRLECVELMMHSLIELGRHREVIGRLYALVSEFPLQEAFYRQLMLALYRSDRRADALKVFQTARQTLDEELGLEPCRALQDMQRAVLAGDTPRVPPHGLPVVTVLNDRRAS